MDNSPMMSVKDAILTRRSIGKLNLPMPSDDEIKTLIEYALCAPDHKQLKPWRFVLLNSPMALAEFGKALLKAGQSQAMADNTVLDEATVSKLVNMPKRAPMILVAISDYKSHPKVTKLEQTLSMGAAVEHILLGLTAMGYQSIWRTGELCNHADVKAFFEVDNDNDIAGFIYIGTSTVNMPKRADKSPADFLQVFNYQPTKDE